MVPCGTPDETGAQSDTNSQLSEAQEGAYPFQRCSSNQFTFKEFMVGYVESLLKIQYKCSNNCQIFSRIIHNFTKLNFTTLKKVSEYDQEIPQLPTADQTTTP